MAGKAKIGAGIALDGEKEFKAAISNINKDLTVLKSALEKNKSAFDVNGKSAEVLNDKLELLSKQYDTQKFKIETLKSALENSQKYYQSCGTKVKELKSSLNSAEKEMEEIKRSSSSTAESFQEQEKKIADLKDELSKAEKGYNKAENAVKDWQNSINKAETDLNKTQKAINDTEKELKEFTTDAKKAGTSVKDAGDKAEKSSHDWEKLGSKVSGAAEKFAKVVIGVGAAFGALGGVAVKIGAEFEAGMSEVEAISQATANDMEKLNAKAKEMGATTKYSATQSAEAFKYMAMAGWDTQDMLDGIEGVMNLAAASGEDLATTSDIVTDSLTAFGMTAKDAGRFSDVLTVAATRSNTTVAGMGETFKNVAPLAGALDYKVEDVAVAIGLMANSGIKGEKAGTALRGMLTNLAKPTDQMKFYMEQLGVSMTDAQGEMKTFDDLMGDLRKSFDGLTESQKAEYAAGIAGKEAMSGLLAIVNASEEDFAALTAQINNSNGAAEKTAKIMNDNLKGIIQILKSALEGLAIEFYESVDAPMKDIVNTATEMVEQLSKAFKKGGLQGLVGEFGTVLADATTKIAENAPKLIDAAIDMINSFIKGLQKNTPKITDAAVKIGKVLLDGLVQIIPNLISLGFDMVSALTDSLLGSDIGNSVKKMGDTITSVFKNVVDIIKKVFDAIKPILGGFVTVVMNIAGKIMPLASKSFEVLTAVVKPLTPLLIGVGAAFLTFKTAPKIVDAIKTSTQLLATGITKVCSGIDLQIAKQTILNTLKNPWTMLAVGVGALVAGIVALCSNMETETTRLRREREEIEANAKAWQKLTEKCNEQLSTELTVIDQTQKLSDELKTLVDANGRVKEGYEARVNFIIQELNSAIGTEMELMDGQILKYDEFKGKIDELIQKKRAQIILESQEELYKEALNKREEEAIRIQQYRAELAAKEAEKENERYVHRRNKLSGEIEELKKNLKASEENLKNYSNTIAMHDTNMLRMASGNAEEIAKIETDITAHKGKNVSERLETLEAQLAGEELHLKTVEGLYKDSNDEIEKLMLESARKDVETTKNKISAMKSTVSEGKLGFKTVWSNLMAVGMSAVETAKPYFNNAMTKNVDSVADGVTKNGWKVGNNLNAVMNDSETIVKNKKGDFETAGGYIPAGISDGIKKSAYAALNAVEILTTNMLGMFNQNLIIQSPSKAFANASQWIPEGVAKGVRDKTGVAVKALSGMVQALKDEWQGSINGFDTPSIGGIQSRLGKVEGIEKQLNLSIDVPKTTNPKVSTTPPISQTFVIQIDKFVNNRSGDVQSFAQELDFYARNANLARGKMR